MLSIHAPTLLAAIWWFGGSPLVEAFAPPRPAPHHVSSIHNMVEDPNRPIESQSQSYIDYFRATSGLVSTPSNGEINEDDSSDDENDSDLPPLFVEPDKPKTSHRHDSSNYLDILASDNTPLLDVRAPIEYNKGSFPNAYNHPLLNDKQRELIGTCYKRNGQDAAISLGYELLDKEDNLKETLVQSWIDHITKHPNGYLFCFRGGLRSHIVQDWIQEATGVHYPLVIGGYKALRSSLLDDLEVSVGTLPIILIGGRTCSGKTIILKHMSRYVDLEGLANHRGSAFGAIAQDDQPAQVRVIV